MAGECLYGAARDMTSNYANGERAAELCALAERPHRERCYFGIGTIIGSLEPTQAGRRAACAEVGRAYAAACRRGAGA
jgi:hypothetical protein